MLIKLALKPRLGWSFKGTSKNCLFPRLRRQLRTRIPKAFASLTGQALLMYVIYTAVLGSGFLLRPTSSLPGVVRAVVIRFAHPTGCPAGIVCATLRRLALTKKSEFLEVPLS